MKIALVFGAFTFGGTERVACELANSFANAGHEVIIVTMKQKEACYRLDDRIVCYNGIPAAGRLGKLRQTRALGALLERCAPDVVVSFMTQINVACITALRGKRIPLIVSERNSPKDMPRSKPVRALRTLLYPRADGFVFQTEDAKNYFSRKIAERGCVIGNPLFLEAEPIPYALRRDEIVSVGRLMPQKDQLTLLQAFAMVHEKYPEYSLRLYGDGPEREKLEAFVRSSRLEQSVTFCGNSSTVQQQIAGAKLFLLSSRYEGMPNALMEALGLGLVCISTDCPCGGPKTLIDDGENGFLCRVGDAGEMAERMERILRDEERQQSVSDRAIASMERYRQDVIAGQWLAYLNRVVKEASK